MKQNHIIQKQAVDVEFQNISASTELKDQLGEVCKSRLLPAIEKLFDDYGKDKYLAFEKLEIDAGMIAFNNWQSLFVEQVVNELKEKLIISRFLQSDNKFSSIHQNRIPPQNNIVHQDIININEEEKHEARILLHFIKTGKLPWFAGELKPDELKHALDVILDTNNKFSNKFFLSELKKILAENINASIRLVYQFTEDQVFKTLSQLSFPSIGFQIIEVWKILLIWLNITKPEQKKIIYSTAFVTAMEGKYERIFLKNFCDYILLALFEKHKVELPEHINDEVLIKKLQNSVNEPQIVKEVLNIVKNFNNQIKSLDTDFNQAQPGSKQSDQNDFSQGHPSSNQSDQNDFGQGQSNSKQSDQSGFSKKQFKNIYQHTEDTESFYISNSGLVILHPFLASLFENVGYLENKLWINEELQQRAIALTNFLVTGSEQLPEFDLLLNKIICGYNIENSIPDFIELGDFEKSEAHDLLRSAINHWKALKNTSIEGLRSTFFIRDGKLTYNDNIFLLQVEQKTVDILLNKLPWSISIIKFPWMRERLIVEWSS